MTTSAPRIPRKPREHAAVILAEPSRERRQALLEAVPAEFRDQVRDHVETAFAKVQAYRRHRADRQQLAKEKPPAAPRREALNVTRYSKSAPEVGNRHLAVLRSLVGGGHGG